MGLKLAADAPISSGDCDLDPRDFARGAISLLADGADLERGLRLSARLV